MSLAGLTLFGIFIWTHDLSWTEDASDTLPVLVAFPLLIWLTMPWKWKTTPGTIRTWSLLGALGLCLAGVIAQANLLLVLGWLLFFDIFQTTFLEGFSRRFLLLPLFGFPWVMQDFPALGWFFRHSGAGAVEIMFQGLGYNVAREGTLLYIGDLPLSIEPACAGLNVLQAMLVAGSLVICLMVPSGWRFAVAVAALLPLAWLANTMRIFMLGFVGVKFGADFAMGWFHQWGGWAVLCVMYLMCQIFFRALSVRASKKNGPANFDHDQVLSPKIQS